MASKPAKSTYVALLRGINVGGKNKLPMAELLEICNGAGCSEVRTYIQSGNVVFEAHLACAKKMPATVAAKIEKRFGFRSTVILRSAKEIRNVVERNPFVRDGADAGQFYVGFLNDKPTAAQIASLDPDRSPGDSFEVIGQEVYMNLLARGSADTKLTTAYFDSKLATTSTFRNWRTVLKLLELVTAAQ